MHGQITKFRSDLGIGVIRTDDGESFRFEASCLVNGACELVGQSVDFVLAARRPRDIIVMAGSPWNVFAG